MTERDDARQAADRARDFLAGLEDVPDDADEVLFESRVEALRRVVPGAGPQAELRLRLAGPNVRDGFYDAEMEAALADPLRREFAAAAGSKATPQVELGLVGVSSGSVVLHYRPKVVELSDAGAQTGVEVVPADAAIRRVLRLHNLFESQADADEVKAATQGNDGLLRGARDVVHALTRFDLEMSATWWAPSGSPVRSRLTRQGRTYAEGIFSQAEQSEPVQVWGLVSALDVDGLVTVRRSGSRHVVKIDPEEIGQFVLGEEVHMIVQRTAQVDRVGLSGRPAFKFVRMLQRDEDVPLALDESDDSAEDE
jgi:hypothetical protein